MNKISLYTTLGCHLCEQAEAIVEPLLEHYDAVIELVEIADSDALLERYGVRIPVLRPQGTTLELAWPFDRDDVLLLFKQAYF